MNRFCLLALLVAGSPATADDKDVAARVNGDIIRLADVDALLTRFKPAGPITSEQTKILRRAVVDELIDEALISQYVAKHAPKADPKEIDRHIGILVEAQKKQGKTLTDFTKETGLSESRLRESFEAMLRFQKLIESRTTDAEYRTWFVANRIAFEGATVKLSHILLRLSPDASDGEIAAVTEKLRTLKADIKAKRISFADAAKKHSLCPTGPVGGNLGVIGRKDGQVEEPVAAAAFELSAGGISEPVRSPAGLHLVLVTDRTMGTPTTYEKSQAAVKEAYAEEMRLKLAGQLRAKADVRISLP